MTKDEAIKWAAGSVTELARHLGLTSQAVSQWVAVPMVHQYRLEKLSGGKLKVDPAERRAFAGEK